MIPVSYNVRSLMARRSTTVAAGSWICSRSDSVLSRRSAHSADAPLK